MDDRQRNKQRRPWTTSLANCGHSEGWPRCASFNFQAKYEGNSLKAGDRRGLKQAFTAYKSNSCVRDLLPLPWCLSSLELVASVDMAVTDVRHPADMFPLDQIMTAHLCKLAQWVIFVQDIVLGFSEEMIKVAKSCDLTLRVLLFSYCFCLFYLMQNKSNGPPESHHGPPDRAGPLRGGVPDVHDA